MNFKNQFITHLKNEYPELDTVQLDSLISENLLSPFKIKLPAQVLEQAKEFIQAAFALRQSQTYQAYYQKELHELNLIDPLNKAMMMSYDFHTDPQHDLKLIEINTNASFLMLGYEMYKAQKQKLPVSDFSHSDIKAMVLNELALQNKKISQPRIAIVDESPSEQKLYSEFLVFNALFNKLGFKSTICDITEITDKSEYDLIYNRSTDFFLKEPKSALLKNQYLDKSVCVSPNPYEYFLLADKQRMIDWSQANFVEKHLNNPQLVKALHKNLPACMEITEHNKEEVWSQRKKLFFKPKRAYGSKNSFKGASLSRKYFDDFLNSEMIAQDYIPAPEMIFQTPDGEQSFKYDLRCYAYQGKLQLIVARLYQGQVTNLRTTYGGFACVEFV